MGGFAIYQARGDWRAAWWTPLALGLGFLAKASTLSLWPVVGLCIVLGSTRPVDDAPLTWRVAWLRLLHQWPRWVGSGLIIFLPALLIAAPWLLRNWQLYGDPSGMALARQTIDLRTMPWGWAETWWLLRGWFFSFWGKFGAVGHLPFPTWSYWLWGGMLLAGLAGIVVAWWCRPRERMPLLLLALAAFVVAFGMWRYSLIALGTDQGRLLFPAIGPLLLLLALGLATWSWGKWGIQLGVALIGLMTLFAIYGLVGVIRPAFAPPPAPTAAEVAATVHADAPVAFGEVTLAGWTLQANPTLYWHAVEAPTQDWRTNLRITAEDGTLVWEWRRSPGYGRFSSDRWLAGTTVRDEYAVQWPEWAEPGQYRVEVTLYPFGSEPGAAFPPLMLGWLEKREP